MTGVCRSRFQGSNKLALRPWSSLRKHPIHGMCYDRARQHAASMASGAHMHPACMYVRAVHDAQLLYLRRRRSRNTGPWLPCFIPSCSVAITLVFSLFPHSLQLRLSCLYTKDYKDDRHLSCSSARFLCARLFPSATLSLARFVSACCVHCHMHQYLHTNMHVTACVCMYNCICGHACAHLLHEMSEQFAQALSA